LQEAKEIEETFQKEIKERRRRQAELFEERRSRRAEESGKHRCFIEKRRSEAKREKELELLRLRDRHEAAELKRSILNKFSEGKSNIPVFHAFSKEEGLSVNMAWGHTVPQRPTYVRNEENVRGNQLGEKGDNLGEWLTG